MGGNSHYQHTRDLYMHIEASPKYLHKKTVHACTIDFCTSNINGMVSKGALSITTTRVHFN